MKMKLWTLLLLALIPASITAQVKNAVIPKNKKGVGIQPSEQRAYPSKEEKRVDDRETIEWQPVYTEVPSEGNEKRFLLFSGSANFEETGYLPVCVRLVPSSANTSFTGTIIDAEFEDVSSDDLKDISDLDKIGGSIEVVSDRIISAKQHFTRLRFVPLRRNSATGRIERLVKFKLSTTQVSKPAPRAATGGGFATSSRLASGTWYKVSVTQDGIHQITHADLVALGIEPDNINPRKIAVYGNGGGMVPVINGDPRHDDLQENAILVLGESDGSFDVDDKIVFYGQGPHRWVEADTTSCMAFHHVNHLYSDKTYYFLKIGGANGKRVQQQVSADTPYNRTTTSFDDHSFFESDENNLLKSGRAWFGQTLDITTSQSMSFGFANRITAEPIKVRTNVVSRSIGVPSSFQINVNGSGFSVTPGSVTGEYYQKYAEPELACTEISSGTSTVSVDLNFNKGIASAQGWLDFFEVNVRRNLTFSGSQILFRDSESVGAGNITEFRLGNANGVTVWDVTDPINARRQVVETSGSTYSWTLSTQDLRQFAAFNGSSFMSVELEGSVSNQNLHGLSQVNMIIVSHPDFESEAERLADFHRSSEKRPLTVHVVTPEEIYNEFSSGAQDICAIRDFMRMFYERASTPSGIARYLLLMGDASYDYKDILDGNTNYVPTFASHESLLPTRSYGSDDYFGMLDPEEGNWTSSSNDALGCGCGSICSKND